MYKEKDMNWKVRVGNKKPRNRFDDQSSVEKIFQWAKNIEWSKPLPPQPTNKRTRNPND